MERATNLITTSTGVSVGVISTLIGSLIGGALWLSNINATARAAKEVALEIKVDQRETREILLKINDSVARLETKVEQLK